VIYCRVSDKEQVDGYSLTTQERICREYCLKNDYNVAEIFIERGESAKTVERTELQKLLAYCANKKNAVKAVVVYKLDRFARNTDDYSQLRLLLKRYGVEIKSTSEYFENTPVGRFMENTMANIAQFDNDIRAERCTGGMKEAMRQGRYVWMAPIGYRNQKIADKATIAQDDMAPFILKTFELIASNIYPTEQIRRMMIKEGLLNKKGRPITKGYFYSMLKNEVFSGWIVKFGEKHRGTFTPIVSDELFNQVQRVLKYKGRKHSAYITDHPDFPLRKFIVNDSGKKITGSWSTGRNKKKYPFYRFGGNSSNYSKHKLEELFMTHMEQFNFDNVKIKRLKEFVYENLVKATQEKRKEEEQLQKKIRELEEKQSSIIKKNLDGYIPDNILKQQLELINKELFDANTSLVTLSSSESNHEEMMKFAEEYLQNPSKIWVEAKIGVKIKLQWFQFPFGLVLQNNFFGNTKTSLFFKAKDLVSSTKSSNVDFGVHFWKQFARELEYLVSILKEFEADKKTDTDFVN
jgi:site-specific DNA recombinase